MDVLDSHQPRTRQPRASRSNPWRFLVRLWRYLLDVFRRPFVSADFTTGAISVTERNKRRRQAILRLFLLCVGISMIFIALPVGILQQFSFPTFTMLFLVAGLSFGGLALDARGGATLVGALFVFGSISAATVFALQNPNGIDLPVLTGFLAFPLFIVIAMLMFPPRLALAAWVGCITATCVVFLMVPSFGTPGSVFATFTTQLGFMFSMVAVQSMIALLSNIVSRSADLGVKEATEAFIRERELTQLKDHFIEDANHELRTPIMSWYGSTELLTHLSDAVTKERRQRALERAMRAGDQVMRLLDSILDATVAESRAPQLHTTTFEVGAIIKATLETFDPRTVGEAGLRQEMVLERTITLHLDPDLYVLADEVRVRQILTNLISNALKYSPVGSPLDITARHMADPKREYDGVPPIVVSVRDRGLGIPKKEADKLFHRFVRLERDIAGQVRGTGVGLFLSRVLIESMGGKIWIESSGVPGEGSAFFFTLPVGDLVP